MGYPKPTNKSLAQHGLNLIIARRPTIPMNVGIQSSGTYWLPVPHCHLHLTDDGTKPPDCITKPFTHKVGMVSKSFTCLGSPCVPPVDRGLAGANEGATHRQCLCSHSVFTLHTLRQPGWPVWLWLEMESFDVTGSGWWEITGARSDHGWSDRDRWGSGSILKWYCGIRKGMPPRLCGLNLADEQTKTLPPPPKRHTNEISCASPLRVSFLQLFVTMLQNSVFSQRCVPAEMCQWPLLT